MDITQHMHGTSQPRTYKCVSVLHLTMPPTSWHRGLLMVFVWQEQKVGTDRLSGNIREALIREAHPPIPIARCTKLPVARKIYALAAGLDVLQAMVVEGVAGKSSRVVQV